MITSMAKIISVFVLTRRGTSAYVMRADRRPGPRPTLFFLIFIEASVRRCCIFPFTGFLRSCFTMGGHVHNVRILAPQLIDGHIGQVVFRYDSNANINVIWFRHIG